MKRRSRSSSSHREGPSKALGRVVHPHVVAIVRELELLDGQLALNEERFEFWVKYLWSRCPRQTSPNLYLQLGTMSFRLSRHECRAALQLFALATLGLDGASAEAFGEDDAFLATQGEDKRRLAQDIAQSTRPLAPPGSGLPGPEGHAARPRNPFRKSGGIE